MSKSLLDTSSLWKLSWFKELSLEYKIAYKYFYDTADSCGFCDLEIDVFQMRTGTKIVQSEIENILGRHFVVFDNQKKVFIPQRFVDLYKGAKDTFSAKIRAIDLISKFGLSEYIYGNPPHPIQQSSPSKIIKKAFQKDETDDPVWGHGHG